MESVDEQETVQVSCDWGTEVGLEDGVRCLSSEGLSIDEGNWHSRWCWLSLANECGGAGGNEGITNVTWNVGEVVVVGSARESVSIPFGNLSSSASQQVEVVEVVTAGPNTIGELDGLSVGTVEISESILVGLSLAVECSSVVNQDVAFSAGFSSQSITVSSANEGGTELDEDLSVGTGNGVQEILIVSTNEGGSVPCNTLSGSTLEFLEGRLTTRESGEVTAGPVSSVPDWVISVSTRERSEDVIDTSVEEPFWEDIGSVSDLEIGISGHQLEHCGWWLGHGHGHEGEEGNETQSSHHF